MENRSTIKNNTTEENLKVLDAIAWRSEWNGKYFAEVRGFDNYFNVAEMIIEELKSRGVKIKFYEDLWKRENERVELRATDYQQYLKVYERK